MLTHSVLELIGNTPLLALNGERIFAKAEFLNRAAVSKTAWRWR